MTATQPAVKGKSPFDWLCGVLLAFGLLCLGVSLPATYEMVRVAHDGPSAVMLVLVLELMAFFALLAELWVPAWHKEFSRIATVLLTITTVGNYAAGWNYIWSNTELEPFWRAIRDWTVPYTNWPLATIALVGVLSAAVPYAMKFFVGLAIKRYRENEIEHTPEAVAARLVEPFVVQVQATRLMQEHLMSLTGQFQNPLVLPDYGRREDEQRHPFAPQGISRKDLASVAQAVGNAHIGSGFDEFLRDELDVDVAAEIEATARERAAALAQEAADEEDPEVQAALEAYLPPNEALVAAAELHSKPAWTLQALLDSQDITREKVLGYIRMFNVKDAAAAYSGLRQLGKLPAGLSLEEFTPLYAELTAPAVFHPPSARVAEALVELGIVSGAAAPSTWQCSGCGEGGSNAQKGTAKKWATSRGHTELRCKDCRDKWTEAHSTNL